jgi:hypothetical protein
MGGVLPFPAARARPPSIDRLRCVECSAPPMIFVPGPTVIDAFCGPACAAACGIEPWRSAGILERAAWRDRTEMEASGG